MNDDFTKAVTATLNGALTDIPPESRMACAEMLYTWLSHTATKRPSADLPQKMEEARKRFVLLADQVNLAFDGNRVVARADGEAAEILRQLRRGTAWFTPFTNVDEALITALLGTKSI